jgi:twitching motility protein PilT
VIDVIALLRFAVAQEASDLHLKVGSTPRVRVNGELRPAPFPPLTQDDAHYLLAELMPEDRMEEYRNTGEADFSVSEAGLERRRSSCAGCCPTPAPCPIWACLPW